MTVGMDISPSKLGGYPVPFKTSSARLTPPCTGHDWPDGMNYYTMRGAKRASRQPAMLTAFPGSLFGVQRVTSAAQPGAALNLVLRRTFTDHALTRCSWVCERARPVPPAQRSHQGIARLRAAG